MNLFSCVNMLIANFDVMNFNELTCYCAGWKEILHLLHLISLLRLLACLSRNNGTSLSFFISFTCLPLPCLLPFFLSLCIKTARTWCLVKGVDAVHRPWGHLFPLIKGECKYLSGQILISIQWEVPSCCLSEPKLCVCVLFSKCVDVCSYKTTHTHRLMGNDSIDSFHLFHLFSPESAFSSFKWLCMRISLDVCVFMHKTWCVHVSDFAAPKWLGGQTAMRCSQSLPELGK